MVTRPGDSQAWLRRNARDVRSFLAPLTSHMWLRSGTSISRSVLTSPTYLTDHLDTMSFEPKQKVELDPPKDDAISLDYLSKCDGALCDID